MFRVFKFIHRVPEPVYELTDLEDSHIEGQFYKYALVKFNVSLQTQIDIDKIVRNRNKDVIKQHYVKWKGYDEIFNSWRNASDIKMTSDNSVSYFPANTKQTIE